MTGLLLNSLDKGLARSFLYAGARALLVSNWAINSAATTQIVSGIFSEGGAASRAEALRRSLVVYLSKNVGAASHPSVWGAFSLIGEGSQSDFQP